MSGLNKQKYHYVYRISNKIKNKHYYGVRSSKVLPKDDLGKKYFSSSTDKDFMNEQKEHPENFKYKVVRVFETRKDAELFEKELHKKFHVCDNEKFYNRCISTLMGFSVEGSKWSEEHRKNQQKYLDEKWLLWYNFGIICKRRCFCGYGVQQALEMTGRFEAIEMGLIHNMMENRDERKK